MKSTILFAAALTALAAPVLAEGDAAKGESDFKKCKACHSIISPDEAIVKGGKTGPNLYGVVGRVAGTEEGFRYSDALITAGVDELIWDEDNLAAYIADPNGFIATITGDSKAKTKMTFKLKDPADVVAYLASVSPEMDPDGSENDN